MRVNVTEKNGALVSLFENPAQTIFLDANFLIPPDRTSVNPKCKPVSFLTYKNYWLNPIFDEFSGMAIHESVLEELVAEHIREYVQQKVKSEPSLLSVHRDSDLTDAERSVENTYIQKISKYSQYDPHLDNRKDRGEVKSLSYMATKGYLYFAANDNLPIRLIEQAEKLNTGLEGQAVIKMYEVLYYLYKTQKYSIDGIKALYKYQYRMTDREKRENPEWGEFISAMDRLYGTRIA